MLTGTNEAKYRDRDWLLMSICEDYVSHGCVNAACSSAHCHPETIAMDNRKKKAIICFEDLKGTCTRPTCHYYHAMKEQKPQIIQRGRERQRIRKEAQEALHQHQQQQQAALVTTNTMHPSLLTYSNNGAGSLMSDLIPPNQKLNNTTRTIFGNFTSPTKEMASIVSSEQTLFSTPQGLYSTTANGYQLPLGYPFNGALVAEANNIVNSLLSMASGSNCESAAPPTAFGPTSQPGPSTEAVQLAANLLLSQGLLMTNYNPPLLQQANYCLAPSGAPGAAVPSSGYPITVPTLSVPVPLTFPTSAVSYPSTLLNPFATGPQPNPQLAAALRPTPGAAYASFLPGGNNVDNTTFAAVTPSGIAAGAGALMVKQPTIFSTFNNGAGTNMVMQPTAMKTNFTATLREPTSVHTNLASKSTCSPPLASPLGGSCCLLPSVGTSATELARSTHPALS